MPEREPDAYVAARVREALVQHPELGELHVEVTLSGDRVFLHGPVETVERQRLTAQVAAAQVPDRTVVNETWVVDVDEPKGAEELS